MRLRGRQEAVDLLEALAQRQRVLEAPFVRDQHRHRHVVGNVRALEHLHAVRELRDHVRAHEARHLEALDAGARELLDQAHLVVGRDHLRLVLEAVARTDLADPNHFAHSERGYATKASGSEPTTETIESSRVTWKMRCRFCGQTTISRVWSR